MFWCELYLKQPRPSEKQSMPIFYVESLFAEIRHWLRQRLVLAVQLVVGNVACYRFGQALGWDMALADLFADMGRADVV